LLALRSHVKQVIPWRMYGKHTALINWSLAIGGKQVAGGERYTLDDPVVIKALKQLNGVLNRRLADALSK